MAVSVLILLNYGLLIVDRKESCNPSDSISQTLVSLERGIYSLMGIWWLRIGHRILD